MALLYSCCFWFSLRLGGILIGIFSLFQALLVLILCCLGTSNSQIIKDEVTNWTKDYNVIYGKDYLENLQADPDIYLKPTITFTSVYMIVCVIFIYGAYKCSNILMVTYILMELLRLLIFSNVVVTFLLLIKQNTMDIGLLIGASVASGFLLWIWKLITSKSTPDINYASITVLYAYIVGMFYLWLCAANLPIVINEMEQDEQAAVINKLQQLLQVNNQGTIPRGLDNIPFTAQPEDIVSRNVFIVPRNKDTNFNKRFNGHSRIVKPHINNFN